MENCKKNATYTSPTIQNEIISLCGEVIQEILIDDAKKASAYAIMSDETADISGKEQLSIGVRYFDEQKGMIREDFLGYTQLENMDAESIASSIDIFMENCGFDSAKCVGQGYDGCSTMSGVHGGVQSILRKKYTKALYFHCASHKLNLVINGLSIVPEVRNTIGTVKEIINFFRESVLRRKYVPNIPAFCETRWSQKYRSIGIFKGNFERIVSGLLTLSKEGNALTRRAAFPLYCAATKPIFIICVFIIAKYSAIFEPIVNALQSPSLDMVRCSTHIRRIKTIIANHRVNVDVEMQNIMDEAEEFANVIEVDLDVPRIAQRQRHRSNHPSSDNTDFWKKSLMIPYLDCLISLLDQRFPEENLPAFSLQSLHPSNMLKVTMNELKIQIKSASEFYQLDNLCNEIDLWYEIWRDKCFSDEQMKNIDVCELIKETAIFLPSIKQALLILLAFPSTTCTIERTFSTLRRVKTWLRSVMGANRLIGEK